MLQTRSSPFGRQAMDHFFEGNGELGSVFGQFDQIMKRQRDFMHQTLDEMTKDIPHFAEHRKHVQEMERSMEKSMQRHREMMDGMTKDMMRGMPVPVQRHREMMDNVMKDMIEGMPGGDMFKHMDDIANGCPRGSWPDFSRMRDSFDSFDMIRQPHLSRGSATRSSKPFALSGPQVTDTVGGAKVGTLEMRSSSKPSNFGNRHVPLAGSPSSTSRQCSRVGTPQRSAGRLAVAPAGATVHPIGPEWKPSRDADHIAQHRVLASGSPAPVLRGSSVPARPAGGGKGSFVRWSGN